MAEDDRWTLPRHQSTDAPELNRVLGERLGAEVITLGSVADRFAWLADDQEAVYAVAVRDSAWILPTDGRWFSRAELVGLPLVVPEHFALLTSWLDDLAHGAPPAYMPWMQPDWFEEATAWIGTQLAALGEQITAPIEQMRVGTTSCILRATSERGLRYFKASGAATHYEARLTAVLARRWPAHMPRVLAADEGLNWLLLDDLGTPVRTQVGKQLDLGRYQELLRQYAQLQRESADEHEWLLGAGVPDRRLEQLPAVFATAVADTRGLLIDHPEGISGAVYQQLQAFEPQVEALCTQLAAYGLPQTLHHDDFHGGNIASNGARYIFFDWGESALTHPLCSLLIVQRSAAHQHGANPMMLNQLRDTYLQAWSDFAPLEQLQEAWPLARQLGALHRALSWHAAAVASAPPLRPYLASAAAYWFNAFMQNDLD